MYDTRLKESSPNYQLRKRNTENKRLELIKTDEGKIIRRYIGSLKASQRIGMDPVAYAIEREHMIMARPYLIETLLCSQNVGAKLHDIGRTAKVLSKRVRLLRGVQSTIRRAAYVPFRREPIWGDRPTMTMPIVRTGRLGFSAKPLAR